MTVEKQLYPSDGKKRYFHKDKPDQKFIMEGNMTTNPYRSENVGFGITYVLPVIVALLSAKEGDTVIIENPEAHIHPAGQRILGRNI